MSQSGKKSGQNQSMFPGISIFNRMVVPAGSSINDRINSIETILENPVVGGHRIDDTMIYCLETEEKNLRGMTAGNP